MCREVRTSYHRSGSAAQSRAENSLSQAAAHNLRPISVEILRLSAPECVAVTALKRNGVSSAQPAVASLHPIGPFGPTERFKGVMPGTFKESVLYVQCTVPRPTFR